MPMVPTWPAPHDAVGWSRLVSAPDGLAGCPPGTAVAALRALYAVGDRRTVDALTVRVSAEIVRRLRRAISTRHPNRGEDAVDLAHDALLNCILDPANPEGDDVARAFEERVHFRALDAIRVETCRARRFTPTPGKASAASP